MEAAERGTLSVSSEPRKRSRVQFGPTVNARGGACLGPRTQSYKIKAAHTRRTPEHNAALSTSSNSRRLLASAKRAKVVGMFGFHGKLRRAIGPVG